MTDKKEKAVEKWENETKAGTIWKEIKDLAIDIYALANQTVKDHVEAKLVPGDVLFVRAKSPAVITSLETVLGKKFAVGTTDGGFITVERIEAIPVDEEYVYFQRRGKVDKIRKKDLI
jgi:hypothetical protein